MSEVTRIEDKLNVSPCACCGQFSLPVSSQASSLLAVCDVLVIKTLEQIGKWVVRSGDRNRYQHRGDTPWHLCHTLWPVPDKGLDRVLANAWDVIPAMLSTYGCCDATPKQVSAVLDVYVRDLVKRQVGHDAKEMREYLSRFIKVD